MNLVYEKTGHIARIGLNRPQQLNALDPGILLELHKTWIDVNEDPQVRVAVLYSALPSIFCAGMDLKTAIPILTGARQPENEAEKWIACGWDGCGVGEAMLKMSFVNKPVIAAIHGYCLTGGFEMVMGADLRVASFDAVFQMREASLGIMPTGGGNVFLPRHVGTCRALEILLTAGNYDAKTMYEWGFLNRVVEKEKLMDTAMELAGKIADNGPLATQGIIRFNREMRMRELRDLFIREVEIGMPIFASQDAREGVRAQKEKRKPDFTGTY
ncbi:MAG TPA: enoyl-CoA hydratase/isomerase family protein [Deltaproteobacteria bacterium]|nr:enoyl-CoA hydratase/isomerase family protein [Deltaproteobacteria bacterium]HQI82173.1 enoyl-CoA hydratase/isomerase family protein [Deltaproteobacteria bacterium]